MNDRENVIEGLNCCAHTDGKNCAYCPYEMAEDCTALMSMDVLDLLKEKKPMQVKTDIYGNAYCPWCSTVGTIEMGFQRLHIGTQFCPYCGKAVKWDG